MAYHARKSPSSANRWGGREGCTASIQAQDGIENTSSDASRFGTCGHQICAEVLLDETIDPQSYLGRKMLFWIHPESESNGEDWESAFGDNPALGQEFVAEVVVDQELIDFCVTHINFVRERVELTGGELFVEQAVPVDHITGEHEATGSTDVGIVYGKTCEIIDLKLGRGFVPAYIVVTPEHNDIITGERIPEVVEPYEQLAMYSSGLMRKLELLYDFEQVVLTISQPPLNRVSQWSGTVAELNVVIDRLRKRSIECDESPTFRPSVSNCHFCRASGNCKAQQKMVIDTALEGFGDIETARTASIKEHSLGDLYAVLPLVSDWCAAVQERVHAALSAGEHVVRSDGLSYKLVAGKKGARAWTSKEEAEKAMLSMRLGHEHIYEKSIISPTTAEKLATPKKVKKGEEPLPPVIGPTKWNRLQELITQGQGQPSIVLETDPRPAVSTTDGFDEVTTE